MRESKDKIKSRMIRNAARIWGFTEPQAESSFDPVVSLLLGACAFELEKISREINNTESRIIERLVNILTPQPITSPHPAHAVAFAIPTGKLSRVRPENQFYADIKVSDQFGAPAEEKQIYFSPTGTFSLTNGRVRYIAGLKRMYEIVDDQYKDILTENFRQSLSDQVLIIGLELNEGLSDLTLFFDTIGEHLRSTLFKDLESCRWKIGGADIKSESGIKDLGYRESDVQQMINREVDLSSKIAHHVNLYFDRQFIRLDLRDIDEPAKARIHEVPAALTGCLDKEELSSLEDNMVWLELYFSSPISDEMLENLTCSLNCFPVINVRLNEYTGSTREILNIIPLHTDDIFFDLKKVTNSEGELYKINHFENQAALTKGSALLRQEGVGRFDARSAMEFLDYLLELLKEEKAAFNVIGSDMISANLRELNQAIARLEKKMEEVQLEQGDTAFLMLKPQDGDRQVFVEFWSTNCSYANNIRAGSPLDVYQAEDIDYNATRLMTTTTGGKEKPSTEERINTYRRALQSGDRVVTKEDIKALCFEHFGEFITDVAIERGIEKGSHRNEGFMRTVDIFLYLKKGLKFGPADVDILQRKLLVLLETRSANILPFRVFFES